MARIRGDDAQATLFYQESLSIRREMSDRTGIAAVLINLGFVAERQDDLFTMATRFSESLGLSIDVKERGLIAICLVGLARMANMVGQPVRAVRLLGATVSLHESIGRISDSIDRPDYDQTASALRAQLSEEAFAAAWAAGRAMTLEQAIADALGADAGLTGI